MTKNIHKHVHKEFDELTLKNRAVRVVLVIYLLFILAVTMYVAGCATNPTEPDPVYPTLFERPEYRQPIRPCPPCDRIRETNLLDEHT